jgi:hypothetical protein
MNMNTLQEPTFVDKVKDSMESSKVYVFCKVGTFPLEWPKKPDGTKSITRNHLANIGNKAVVVGSEVYRDVVTRHPSGEMAHSLGYEQLDKSNPDDMEFLDRIKDFIANSGDPRIEKYGLRVEEGNPYPPPFARWDDLSADTALEMAANMLGDDQQQNEDTIAAWAKYELAKDKPRKAILDGLNLLAADPGDESGDTNIQDQS